MLINMDLGRTMPFSPLRGDIRVILIVEALHIINMKHLEKANDKEMLIDSLHLAMHNP